MICDPLIKKYLLDPTNEIMKKYEAAAAELLELKAVILLLGAELELLRREPPREALTLEQAREDYDRALAQFIANLKKARSK